jgi:hypothetical protein
MIRLPVADGGIPWIGTIRAWSSINCHNITGTLTTMASHPERDPLVAK